MCDNCDNQLNLQESAVLFPLLLPLPAVSPSLFYFSCYLNHWVERKEAISKFQLVSQVSKSRRKIKPKIHNNQIQIKNSYL
jgi:hypothetical protein